MKIDIGISFIPFANILGEGMNAARAAEPVRDNVAAEGVAAEIVTPGQDKQRLVGHG